MIIGIIGKKQSGKDTLATILQELLEKEGHIFDQKAFAYKVKQFLSILTGIPVEDMEKEEVKNTYLGDEWTAYALKRKGGNRELFFPSTKKDIKNHVANFKDSTIIEKRLTIRQALQYIGTDLFRDRFHENTWINALFNEYIKHYHFKEGDNTYRLPNWIITDVRFPNEANSITDKGGFLIKIERPHTCLIDTYKSETSIDLIKEFDFYLENSFDILIELHSHIKKNLLPFILKAFNLK